VLATNKKRDKFIPILAARGLPEIESQTTAMLLSFLDGAWPPPDTQSSEKRRNAELGWNKQPASPAASSDVDRFSSNPRRQS